MVRDRGPPSTAPTCPSASYAFLPAIYLTRILSPANALVPFLPPVVMSVGLRADRPDRAIQSGGRVRVFAAVGTVDSDIRGTVRVSRRPRHAAVYCAHNGRRDQPWFVRSCSARALRRGAPVTHLSSTQLRHCFKRLGPVCLQQAGERAVGEQLAAGLAGRAIVRLVLRVDDPLDR
jgi:hypothetical protein